MLHNNKPIILERSFYPKGTTVIRKGDYAGRAFLIQTGEVSIQIPRDGESVEIAKIGSGEIVGEMGVLQGGKRTADVVTTMDTTLIVLNRDTLEDKLSKSDPTIRALVGMLTERILNANEGVADKSALDDEGARDGMFVRPMDFGACDDALDIGFRVMVEEAEQAMEGVRKRAFQSIVRPRFEELIDALDRFEDEYPEGVS